MQKLTYSILTLGWSVAILFLTLSPDTGVSQFWLLEIPGMDKVAHFGIFFILALMGFSFAIKNHSSIIWAVIYVTLIAIIGEYGQLYVEGRTNDIRDFVANMIGMSVGGFVAQQYRKYL